MNRRCPECGSSRLHVDGDLVEDLCHPDRTPMPLYLYEWFVCEECHLQWRFPNQAINSTGEVDAT